MKKIIQKKNCKICATRIIREVQISLHTSRVEKIMENNAKLPMSLNNGKLPYRFITFKPETGLKVNVVMCDPQEPADCATNLRGDEING